MPEQKNAVSAPVQGPAPGQGAEHQGKPQELPVSTSLCDRKTDPALSPKDRNKINKGGCAKSELRKRALQALCAEPGPAGRAKAAAKVKAKARAKAAATKAKAAPKRRAKKGDAEKGEAKGVGRKQAKPAKPANKHEVDEEDELEPEEALTEEACEDGEEWGGEEQGEEEAPEEDECLEEVEGKGKGKKNQKAMSNKMVFVGSKPHVFRNLSPHNTCTL